MHQPRQSKPLLSVLSALACAVALSPAAANADGATDTQAMAAGFRTVDSMCFSCHSPDPAASEAIAPSMADIRQQYMNELTDLETFSHAMVEFVNDPSAQNARIEGAVERYGLMPKMAFDTEVLEDVAYYLYHAELDAPSWYAQEYPREQERYAAQQSGPVSAEDFRRHGQQLAMQTKTALGSNLKKALGESGPEGAVNFCNVRAVPIAQEMSAKLGASIKRVTDRPRNPANAANAEELAVIRELEAALARGEAPGSVVHEHEQSMVGYYPVVTNGMCLLCHGTVGEQVAEGTEQVIKGLYPEDRATGYDVEQLRGIFVVTMDKPQ